MSEQVSTKKTNSKAKNRHSSRSSSSNRSRQKSTFSGTPAVIANGFLSAVQFKVAIGNVNDPYEREANRVANIVGSGGNVSMPGISRIGSGGLRANSTNISKSNTHVQRQEEDEEKPVQEITVQTQVEEEESAQAEQASE